MSENEYERVGTCVCKPGADVLDKAERRVVLQQYIPSLPVKQGKIV